ncbi:hypothetical protein, partial [Campylobacter porcelli]|nr:hypothetical protein [Campylobacter sp. CX2-4855-23]
VYYTRVYDIKSQSVAPYSYDNWLDLGLNQYFMGQSPYNWYDGDPGDGILDFDILFFILLQLFIK